jgi:uncharacterized membrane protein (DUF4010 family)
MSIERVELLQGVLIAMALGFLIGLEREYAKRVVDKEEQFAGVRTHAFAALFGFLCAYLAQIHGGWVLVGGLMGFIALVIATYVMLAKSGSYGITTELSSILTFVIGAVVFQGEVLFAVIAAVTITTLLSMKLRLHSFIETLTPMDIRAFIQFVIISAVVLPFLPNEPFGPNGVWNLHEIWIMVILVTGISLTGYLLAKLFGTRKGTLLAGVVGGLVSSTAVTLSMAKRSREQPNGQPVLVAASILAATAVLYPRIWLETWLVNKDLAMQLAIPIGFITLVSFGVAYAIQRKSSTANMAPVAPTNPLNFSVAIQFAVIYMAVLWLMDLAAANYSAQGLYAASIVFGATDMDAITLSIAKGTQGDGVLNGMTAVLLATLSNTVMKYLIVVFFGDRALRKWVGVGFGSVVVATVLAMLVVRSI